MNLNQNAKSQPNHRRGENQKVLKDLSLKVNQLYYVNHPQSQNVKSESHRQRNVR